MHNYSVKNLHYPALLLVVCIIAYLPLSSFLFAPKNDAYIYNFPNKFFFSECLKNGHLPTWNPYLNFGFPLYADPGFAWWHPLTWIFGLIGYNAYTFSIEILLYIYIGGLGMYWLGNSLKFHRPTAFAIACMFMCSGFFIGNLQHVNFLTAAAFIPWLTGSWLLYQKAPTNKHLLYNGLCAYLLFTAGHPAIPIGTIYFFACLTIVYLVFLRKEINVYVFTGNQFKLLLCILIFLFPLIHSYFSILPYYSRSEVVNQLDNIHVGFTPPSYISFILPFATIRDNGWFSTDVSMRNAYFSLLGIFGLFYFLLNKQKEKLSHIFLITGVFMLLLAMGGVVKEVVYKNLPGLQLIRTNGEYRVFTIFCFILCAGYTLNFLFFNNSIIELYKRKVFRWSIPLLLLFAIIFSINSKTPRLGNNSFTENIKSILAQITFHDSVFVAILVALGFSVLYQFTLKGKKAVYFTLLVLIGDLILNSWLLLPVTGVGKTSVTAMQSIIDKSPEGFPTPSIRKDSKNNSLPISPTETTLIGNWAWYEKEIMHPLIDYPSQLKSTIQLTEKEISNLISDKPFYFLKHQKGELTITSFSPNAIKTKANIIQTDTLVLVQNDFKGWDVSVNHVAIQHIPYLGAFMAVPLNKGTNNIEWRYTPNILGTILIWVLLFTVCILVLKLRRNRNFQFNIEANKT
jgi:hypothetical protein